MDNRKLALVTCIVRHYIQSAQPVGSVMLVEKYQLGYSSATVRNELALLEDFGYMRQPHPSSGRIPTGRAYELYVESIKKPQSVTHKQRAHIQTAWNISPSSLFSRLKTLAKALAQETHELVYFSIRDGETYCTGFSYLCEKPEFEDKRFARMISHAVDRIDEYAKLLFDTAEDKPQVFIGRKSIFSDTGSTIFVKFSLPGSEGVLGLAGPMRMDYSKNISLLCKSKEIIES